MRRLGTLIVMTGLLVVLAIGCANNGAGLPPPPPGFPGGPQDGAYNGKPTSVVVNVTGVQRLGPFMAARSFRAAAASESETATAYVQVENFGTEPVWYGRLAYDPASGSTLKLDNIEAWRGYHIWAIAYRGSTIVAVGTVQADIAADETLIITLPMEEPHFEIGWPFPMESGVPVREIYVTKLHRFNLWGELLLSLQPWTGNRDAENFHGTVYGMHNRVVYRGFTTFPEVSSPTPLYYQISGSYCFKVPDEPMRRCYYWPQPNLAPGEEPPHEILYPRS